MNKLMILSLLVMQTCCVQTSFKEIAKLYPSLFITIPPRMQQDRHTSSCETVKIAVSPTGPQTGSTITKRDGSIFYSNSIPRVKHLPGDNWMQVNDQAIKD